MNKGPKLINAYYDCRLFHRTFFGDSIPIPDKPKLLSEEEVERRCKFMDEELGEFRSSKTIVDQADAMIDLIYFGLGTLVEMGVNPENLWNIVQFANMSKVWEDGLVHRNEDNKVIKPPTWKDPYPLLEKDIEAQSIPTFIQEYTDNHYDYHKENDGA